MAIMGQSRMPPFLALLVSGVALVPAVGYLDHLSGSQLSLFILYVVPVLLATSRAGRLAGALIALESAFVWFLADWGGDRVYPNPLVPAWNSLARFAQLLAIAGLQSLWLRERGHARTDHLTGLANRAWFRECAGRELGRARRYGHAISVCYLDIDDFKQVNDTFGHEAGDRLLRVLGKTLRENTRASDLTARLGGDEFALLLPHTDGPAARALVDKLHRLLLDAMREGGWAVDFSFGLATFLVPPATVDELTRVADRLMYEAKKAGKGDVRQESYGP